jgi:hypothetical protein
LTGPAFPGSDGRARFRATAVFDLATRLTGAVVRFLGFVVFFFVAMGCVRRGNIDRSMRDA